MKKRRLKKVGRKKKKKSKQKRLRQKKGSKGTGKRKTKKRKTSMYIKQDFITSQYCCCSCGETKPRYDQVIDHIKRCNAFQKEFGDHSQYVFSKKRYSDYSDKRKPDQLQPIADLIIPLVCEEEYECKLLLNDISTFLDFPSITVENSSKSYSDVRESNTFLKSLVIDLEKEKTNLLLEVERKNSELEQLKLDIAHLRSKEGIFESLESISSGRSSSNKQDNTQFHMDAIDNNDWFKFSNSILLGHSSKNEIFDFFCKKHITFNRNFLYKPENFRFCKVLIEDQKKFWDSQEVLLVHYDNNDIKTPYSKFEKYIPTTAYSVFIPKIRHGLNVDNFSKWKEKPPYSRDSIWKCASEILNFDVLEKAKVTLETDLLIGKMLRGDYLEAFNFFGEKKRQKKSFNLTRDDFRDEKTLLKKFREFLLYIRKTTLPATKTGCKTEEQFKADRAYIYDQLKHAKFILLSGDQPVYHSSRKQHKANFGKFHTKLNSFKGSNSLFYPFGMKQLQEKYFNTSKNLKDVPNGYYKIMEQLFVNTFIAYWDLLIKIFKEFCSHYNRVVSVAEFKTFIPWVNEMKSQFSDFRLGGFSLEEISGITYYCLTIGMSQYLYLKCIKTCDRYLYTSAIKMKLSWFLECGSTKKTKYFNDLSLHLFDIKYLWPDDLVTMFFDNIAYQTESDNFIPFDEMCEIDNKVIKPLSQNRGQNPFRKMLSLSTMDNIIRFVRKLHGSEYTYTKDKVNMHLLEDLQDDDNVIETFLLSQNPTKIHKEIDFSVLERNNLTKKVFEIICKSIYKVDLPSNFWTN